MTKKVINIIKLCVGAQNVSELYNWQKNRIVKVVVEKLFGSVADKKIGILGFSFKANTNDTSESAAINFCNDLLEEGAVLFIHDPKVDPKQIEIDLGKKENSQIKKIQNQTHNKERFI